VEFPDKIIDPSKAAEYNNNNSNSANDKVSNFSFTKFIDVDKVVIVRANPSYK
jgi:hypothetical protein